MTMSTSTLLTAGLLAGLILAGSLVPVHAGDGGDQGTQQSRTGSQCSPTQAAVETMSVRTSAD